MPDGNWNPWKMTAIAMALVIATAVATGLVVASWTNKEATPTPSAATSAANPAVARPPGPPPPPGQASAPEPARRVATAPSQADVDACNQQARSAAGDKTMEVVKDAAIGGALGAGVGAAGGAVAKGGHGAGQGAGIGAIVGAAAGTLFGLNENRSHDSRYVGAYRSCMRGRGYTG